jgi:HD-GYP domain-containing protein (c-di-GMP phosphodiesterase class II)
VKAKEEYSQFEKQYKEYIIHMRDLLKSVTLGVYNDIEKVTSFLTEQIYNNISESDYILHCLHSMRHTDEYTYTHSINTAFYSMLIGNWINLSKAQVCELISASLVHDIGKTRIPLNILNKQGKLDASEYEIMKKHTILGYHILDEFPEFNDDLKNAVLLHHERMDGSGYPYGLKGNSICLYSKIISIADVYDAMTQNRIYKNKVSPFDSFEMFLTEGMKLFDFPILYEFLKHMAPLYVGNKVELNNGDIGEIVYIPPQDITSPILYINSEYMDLSKNIDLKVLQVVY